MTRTFAATAAITFAFAMGIALHPSTATAQEAPCSGHASVVNGQIVVGPVTPAGMDSTCEVLVTPGGATVQNGGNTHAADGVDATHESTGHGS